MLCTIDITLNMCMARQVCEVFAGGLLGEGGGCGGGYGLCGGSFEDYTGNEHVSG
jgi:hypothetical protein